MDGASAGSGWVSSGFPDKVGMKAERTKRMFTWLSLPELRQEAKKGLCRMLSSRKTQLFMWGELDSHFLATFTKAPLVISTEQNCSGCDVQGAELSHILTVSSSSNLFPITEPDPIRKTLEDISSDIFSFPFLYFIFILLLMLFLLLLILLLLGAVPKYI